MVVVGVVEQFKLERLARAVTGLGQQRFGLGITLGLAQLGPGRCHRFEAVDKIRNERVARGLALAHHLVGDHVAIDGIGERGTHSYIIKRLMLEVVLVVVSPHVATDLHLFRVLLLHLLEALDRHVVGEIEFTGQITVQLGVGGLDRQVSDLVDHRLGVVPVVGVALDIDALVDYPILQLVGTVGDHVGRLGPLVTKLLDHLLRYRISGGVGQHADEIGDRFFQLDLEGVIVHRLHAQGIGRLLAADDVGRIDDGRDFHVPGIGRGGLGIHCPLEGELEIVGGDGIPVGPLGIFAQVEHEVFVVLGFPGFGHAGQGLTLGA
ncbi:hypothetical protein D3C84_424150 [compost metagenome]